MRACAAASADAYRVTEHMVKDGVSADGNTIVVSFVPRKYSTSAAAPLPASITRVEGPVTFAVRPLPLSSSQLLCP